MHVFDYSGTDPTVAYDLEAVMAYQRKLWLGILAIGVATAAMQLPAALSLFVTGLAGVGLLNWRRKKKAQV